MKKVSQGIHAHTYLDGDNTYNISVSVTDEDGTHAGAGTMDVVVNDIMRGTLRRC